ncbi:ABC sugar (glycerol) transporter, ATPase subunit [Erythrobacter sp. NAP1]|uniref:ABC transporter ATP-binding protein n=1 Tax=Erythrobacter sp. NAP1 TaxID=237727 RepID=UPI00006851F1|nr:ABC transporter ATP-binding protein [Erythrobacter sp. NAP1]EAQ27682.1 ABC sugar (glycerol) transporter, ATPase subunit [Erythrobacter sp. NAP1]
MAAITLDKIAHSYRPDPMEEEDFALKELNHQWEDGRAYALLGPSGCGKTTLLNIMSGLLEPSRGRILFDGEDVTHASTAQRNIAQVFQFPVVYDTMTVRENLAFPLRNRGMEAGYIAERVAKVAQMIGLEDHLRKKARGLTADLKQKISLGRGVVRDDVNAILFDEPLTVIDPHLKWELRTQLKSLHDEFGHTMVYVTHDQTEALTFADEVVVMHEGRVLQIGTPQALFEEPAHTFVGYFIGSPGMNFLPVEIEGAQAHAQGETISLGSNYGRPGGRAALGIRPEFLTLTKGEGLPVTVNRLQDVGRQKFINASVFGTEINIVADAGFEIEAGMDKVTFDPRAASIFCDEWRIEGTPITSENAEGS